MESLEAEGRASGAYTGWVYDVQRFSTHDGPGIRTTVFFKGCGMRCLWCHNPESWSLAADLQLFGDLCIACGRCVPVCGAGARRFEAEALVLKRELCTLCGACADACPSEALKICGTRVEVGAVVSEVLRDRTFYANSGGGVTLSGGEPLLQHLFAAAILAECAREGVHTAVETAGCVDWSAIEAVLPVTDLLLLDLKCIDRDLHARVTGTDNAQILENARRLGSSGVPLIIRMPIVPGVNDDRDHVRKVAAFAARLPSAEVLELLPFHSLGSHKALSVGRVPWHAGKSSPSAEDMDEFVAIACAEGIATRTT